MSATEEKLRDIIREMDNYVVESLGIPSSFLKGDKDNSFEYFKEVILEKQKFEDIGRKKNSDKD